MWQPLSWQRICQRKKNIVHVSQDWLFFFSHSDNDPQMWKPNTQWSSIYNYVKHSKTAHFQMKESGTSNNLTFLPDQ